MKLSPKWMIGLGMVPLLLGGYMILKPSGEISDGKSDTGFREKISSRGTTLQSDSTVARQWHGLTDAALPREERLDLARKIHSEISPQEAEYLFNALKHTPEPQDESNWWLVANETMGQMCNHGAGSEIFTEKLSAIIGDDSLSVVIRDYGIQHLGNWLAPAAATSPGETDQVELKNGLQAIASAIKDPSLGQTSIPGTGLMTLADASTRLDGATIEPIWLSLKSFLSEVIEGKSEVSPLIRSSAIQAVARGNRLEYHAAIRQLAGSNGIDPSLRLSSISALGNFAKAEDADFLRSLASSDNVFQYAARSALERLQGTVAQ